MPSKRPSWLYVVADTALLCLAIPVLLGFMALSLVVSVVLRKPPYDPRWDWQER